MDITEQVNNILVCHMRTEKTSVLILKDVVEFN